MPKVRITGWNPGLQKISMTKAIRTHAQMNLAEAKRCTEAVLNGEIVLINVRTQNDASMLVKTLVSIGANAEAIDASL